MEENIEQKEGQPQAAPEAPKQPEPQQQAEQPEKVEEKKETTGDEKDVTENKLWALLSYFGILVIIPLFGKKDSSFAQFHAKQGLVLLIGWIISWAPVFGGIIGIIVLVFSIFGIIYVLKGEKKKLPFVGDLAEKITL